MSLMPVIAFVHHHTLLIPYAHDSSLPIYSVQVIPAAKWLPQFYAMSLRPPCFQFSDLNRIQFKEPEIYTCTLLPTRSFMGLVLYRLSYHRHQTHITPLEPKIFQLSGG